MRNFLLKADSFNIKDYSGILTQDVYPFRKGERVTIDCTATNMVIKGQHGFDVSYHISPKGIRLLGKILPVEIPSEYRLFWDLYDVKDGGTSSFCSLAAAWGSIYPDINYNMLPASLHNIRIHFNRDDSRIFDLFYETTYHNFNVVGIQTIDLQNNNTLMFDRMEALPN
jgi:hypothetical protein